MTFEDRLSRRRSSHRRGTAIPGPFRAANRAASSKQPRFFRHRRRFGCFPCGSGLKWKKCTCKEYHD